MSSKYFIEFNLPNKIGFIKNIYDKIHEDIIKNNGLITFDNYKFNNYTGDITKNIRWTWAINNDSLSLFQNYLQPINKEINDFFGNDFKVFGASFITLYEDEVNNTQFHLDTNSQYDDINNTNILTIIFPLYIDNDMGGLEYLNYHTKEIEIYKYKKDKLFIWDSCKLEHRTQPYKLKKKKKRVLVSLNLTSKEEWALISIEKSLTCQGNITI